MKHQIALSMTLLTLAAGTATANTLPDGHLEKINALQAAKGKPALTADALLVRPIRLFGNQLTSYFTRIRDDDLRLLAQQINESGGPALSAHVTDDTPIGTFYAAAITPGGGDVLWLDTWVYFLNDQAGQDLARRIDGGVINEASIGYWYERNVCSITGLDYWYSPYYAGQEYEITDPETGTTTTRLCFLWTIGNVEFAEGSLVYRGAYPGTQVGGDIGANVTDQAAQNARAPEHPQTRFQLAAARDMQAAFQKKAQADRGPDNPAPAPVQTAQNAAKPDPTPEGEPMKLKLKMPDGSTLEFEPDQLQTQFDRAVQAATDQAVRDTTRTVTESVTASASAAATTAERSRVAAALGLKAEDLVEDTRMQTLSAEAGDGRLYREDLLNRLERVTVTLDGTGEKAEQAGQRMRRIFSAQKVDDIREEVERLEAKRDATVPNTQLSRDVPDGEGSKKRAPGDPDAV